MAGLRKTPLQIGSGVPAVPTIHAECTAMQSGCQSNAIVAIDSIAVILSRDILTSGYMWESVHNLRFVDHTHQLS